MRKSLGITHLLKCAYYFYYTFQKHLESNISGIFAEPFDSTRDQLKTFNLVQYSICK